VGSLSAASGKAYTSSAGHNPRTRRQTDKPALQPGLCRWRENRSDPWWPSWFLRRRYRTPRTVRPPCILVHWHALLRPHQCRICLAAQDVWHTISDAEIALTVFERVAGLHISTSATSDGQLQFWDWPTAETNPPVIRAEITVPAFTAVRGRYTVNSVDPITGVGTGPDDDAPTVTAWEPPAQTTGHQGYFAFGTDLEIVDGEPTRSWYKDSSTWTVFGRLNGLC
jgi:hypothetical protein